MHNMGLARLYQRLEGSRVGADTVDLTSLMPTSSGLLPCIFILSAISTVDLGSVVHPMVRMLLATPCQPGNTPHPSHDIEMNEARCKDKVHYESREVKETMKKTKSE